MTSTQMLDITIDPSFKKEMEEAIKDELENMANTSIFYGFMNLSSEMKENLKWHIEKDVYDVYQPKSYPRRSVYPAFGIPLNAVENKEICDTRIVNMLKMEFIYTPSGEHDGTLAETLNWDKVKEKLGMDKGADPLKPNPKNGDELIKIIETGQGYDWRIPKKARQINNGFKRPFWTNFINDQKNGETYNGFASGFARGQYELIPEGGEKDVVYEDSDYALD